MANDKRLDTDIEPERQRLKEAVGISDPSDMEILGYGVMYTVGYDFNCIVPRDWLLDRINDLGIPQWLAPSEPSPHYAFDRAIKWMDEQWLDDYYIEAPRMDNGVPEDHHVTVDLKEGDGNRIWHVRAEVFFDEEESGQEGGTWARHELGYITYNKENQTLVPRKDDGLDEDNHLHQVWQDVVSGADELFQTMLTHHVGGDIRRMMHGATRDYTNNVIQLKRSVYLFPAGMGDFVEKMAQLYEDINANFKTTGEPVAIRTFEVLNTDDKQEWVQHKVEQTLEDNLESILSEGFEKFDEGEAASQVVKVIRQNLSDDLETAETYNALLEAEIDIEKELEEQKSQVTDADKEEIIEQVIEQSDVDDF